MYHPLALFTYVRRHVHGLCWYVFYVQALQKKSTLGQYNNNRYGFVTK